ncbi:ATP-binding protein [Persicobacter psychrovividus]|uniref:ATPase AAA n=1 Tax=Persicobacter psychrovividus TaxID=387638 RepID=A0ABM7VMZ9_9BACT|nr:ATPase AAA [Persicobacter psychrovividus]
MDKLHRTFRNIINSTDLSFQRKFDINWKNRMTAIIGARGVGKTTWILQQIKQRFPNLEQVLFASLDDLIFSSRTLVDVVDEFYAYGGRFLFLDEVHKYANWSQELKNIYDSYPDLKVVFTSSSILNIYKGEYDLSRRVIQYQMDGMTFQEFLELKYQIKSPALTFEQILDHEYEVQLAEIGEEKVLSYFHEYLSEGYYPFTIEPNFHFRLKKALEQVIDIDLLKIESMTLAKGQKIKKVLAIIADMVPYKPNISALSKKINIHRDEISLAFHLLERARILNLLIADTKGFNVLPKPEKIYFENTNLAYALSSEPEIGNVRETFFLNAMKNAGLAVNESKKSDFLVSRKWTFEIGGRNKTLQQIKGLENTFIVQDGITRGALQALPLWAFGFLSNTFLKES